MPDANEAVRAEAAADALMWAAWTVEHSPGIQHQARAVTEIRDRATVLAASTAGGTDEATCGAGCTLDPALRCARPTGHEPYHKATGGLQWSDNYVPTEPVSADGPWRVGSHYGVHVYEGNRVVATFHDPADAQRAVDAVNAQPGDDGLRQRIEALIGQLNREERESLLRFPASRAHVTHATSVASVARRLRRALAGPEAPQHDDGEPQCAALNPDGWRCGHRAGHDGEHRNHGGEVAW